MHRVSVIDQLVHSGCGSGYVDNISAIKVSGLTSCDKPGRALLVRITDQIEKVPIVSRVVGDNAPTVPSANANLNIFRLNHDHGACRSIKSPDPVYRSAPFGQTVFSLLIPV